MSDRAPWRRLVRLWAGTLVLGLLLGTAGGAALGHLLARLSFDYIVRPSDYLAQGWRLGLWAGAVVGACQVVGCSPPVLGSGLAGARALALALAVALLAVAACAGGGWLAYRAGWLDVSAWHLPNPSRHALLIGADLGVRWGAPLGACLAGAWVLWQRRRCALP
jgi:hypothetical protein